MLKSGKKRARREHQRLREIEYKAQLARKEFVSGALVVLDPTCDRQIVTLGSPDKGRKYEIIRRGCDIDTFNQSEAWHKQNSLYDNTISEERENKMNSYKQIYTIKTVHNAGWENGVVVMLEGFKTTINCSNLIAVKAAPKRTIF